MTKRTGVGRIRHLDSRTLWLQSETERGTCATKKVDGKHNLADLGTKNHSGPRIRQFLLALGFGGVPDRRDRGVHAVQQAPPMPGTFLPYEDLRKLFWLAAVLEAATRASGSELAHSMKPLEETASAVPWTLILMMILFVFAIGCCCGALALWLVCRRQRQVAATPALPARALELPALEDAGGAVAVEALADATTDGDLVGLRQRSAVHAAPAALRTCIRGISR